MADYPSSIKTFTALTDGIDNVLASHQNEPNDEITAIETELGIAPKTITDATAPAASPTSVAQYLDMVATQLKAISGGANWYTTPTSTIAALLAVVIDGSGWTTVTDTWTYASATTINVPTDATTKYGVGTKIRWKQGGAYKYGVLGTVAATLLTCIANNDYSVANAAITDIAYSNYATPFGFPPNFNYSPGGIAASNVTVTGKFSVRGRFCIVDIYVLFSGGITFTSMPVLPIAPSGNIGSMGDMNGVYYTNASGWFFYGLAGGPLFGGGVNTDLRVASSGAQISATVPVTWANTDRIEVHMKYYI